MRPEAHVVGLNRRGRGSQCGALRSVGRKGLALASSGLGLAAAVIACSSTTGVTPITTTTMQPAYLYVKNSGSVPATLTIDLAPPVQRHVGVNTCSSLQIQVPDNDSVKVVVTDSTSTTSATFDVPFYEAGVWGLDCAPGRGPEALGSIGQVPNPCTGT